MRRNSTPSLSILDIIKNPNMEDDLINKALLMCQKEVNSDWLKHHKSNEIQEILKSIFSFLLTASASQNSSVRLLAYRTTAIFLLRVMPFYPKELTSSFSDISTQSTIDIKSSAIIAASFSFISHHISPLHLEEFLDSTPVFHHFAISDKIFSDHLASIISHLGNLGIEWHLTLLRAFLEKILNSSDRYLFRSIAALIKLHPYELTREFLNFIRERSSYSNLLPLISFILTSCTVPLDKIDITEVATTSCTILSTPKEFTLNQIDSSLQILEIQSPTYSLTISRDTADSDRLILNLNDKHFPITISSLNNRPSFYLLPLPLDLILPSEKDGSFTVRSKYRSLARRLSELSSDEKDNQESSIIMNVFEKATAGPYDELKGAALQGFASSLKNFSHKNTPITRFASALIRREIIIEPTNWFEASDILRLIDASKELSVKALGKEKLLMVLLKLLDSPNEDVSAQASETILSFIKPDDECWAAKIIASNLDFFDFSRFKTHLKLLLRFADKAQSKASVLVAISFLVDPLIELALSVTDDLSVFSLVINFLSEYDLSHIISRISSLFSETFFILCAGFGLISGKPWQTTVESNIEKYSTILENEFRACDLDLFTQELKYKDVFSSIAATAKFVFSMPLQAMDSHIPDTVAVQLIPTFPEIVARFLIKNWNSFHAGQKALFKSKFLNELEFMTDPSIISKISIIFPDNPKIKECLTRLKDNSKTPPETQIQNDQEFEFDKIDKSTILSLYSAINYYSYLPTSSFQKAEFSPEFFNRLIWNCLSIGDDKHFLLTCQVLNDLKIDFSFDGIPIPYHLLDKIPSYPIHNFICLSPDITVRNISLKAAKFFLNEYLQLLKEKQKLQKSDLIFLLTLLQEQNITSLIGKSLNSFIISQFSGKQKRLSLCMKLLTMCESDTALVTEICAKLSENLEFLPIEDVGRFLLKFYDDENSKIPHQSKFITSLSISDVGMNFLDKIQDSIAPQSPAAACQACINAIMSKPLKLISPLCTSMLEFGLPSFFCWAMKVISRTVNYPDFSKFFKVEEIFSQPVMGFGITESAAILINAIGDIEIKIATSRAECLDFPQYLTPDLKWPMPQMFLKIFLTNLQNENTQILQNIKKQNGKFIQNSRQKQVNEEALDKNKTIINQAALEWISLNCDSYWNDYAIFYWALILKQAIGIEQTASMIVFNFLRKTKRFFTAFVGIARFLQELDENDKSIMIEVLKSILPDIHVKEHKEAFEFLIQGKQFDGFQLACYEKDCSSSETLFSSFK